MKSGLKAASGKFEWTAELIIDLKASSDELAQVCHALVDGPHTMILTVVPTVVGTKIACSVTDPGTFLSSLSDLPGVASWRFAPN